MKNTTKKGIALLLALIFALGLVSCGKGGEDGESEPSDAIGFFVNYNGTRIELGKKATGALVALGEAKSRKEIGDCGGLGAQVRYDYSSLILYVLESKDGAVIDSITLLDDLVETSKGIVIGSKESEITAAYGTPDQTEGDRLSYVEGDMQLIFTVKDGRVSAIDLLTVTQ